MRDNSRWYINQSGDPRGQDSENSTKAEKNHMRELDTVL